MCPIIDGQHAPTGCVATAMAQVMYYYKWPEQGRGIVEGYYISGKGVDEATDLSKSIYQWNLMLPQYTTGASKDSREAVALLLHDIGRSVHMDYDSLESGASSHYVIPVLTTNFDYDKGGRFLQRNFCSTEKWEDVLRSEISNGRPVMYSASNGSASHEFVCDGYDDKGYFYFNYGWNGASNGYYLTSATLFNIGQEIIYGIEKNKVLTNIQSSSKLFLRNVIVFLKYLQEIINKNKFESVYKDPIIKIDISLIIGYLSNKYGKDTVESVEFFLDMYKRA